MKEGNYQPVPVDDAKRIAERYQKTHVVIVSYDETINVMHVTTYGLRDQRDKQNAANIGEFIANQLGADLSLGMRFQDFGANALRAAEARGYAKAMIEMGVELP